MPKKSEIQRRRPARPKAAPPHPNRRAWAAAEIDMLGKISDAQLARLLGIARRTVLMERRRRGIAPAHRENRPKKLANEP